MIIEVFYVFEWHRTFLIYEPRVEYNYSAKLISNEQFVILYNLKII